MKQIVIFPRGQLTSEDKDSFAKAGILVAEADDPSKVVSVLPMTSLICPDDFIMAALAGINAPSYNSSTQIFCSTLEARLKSKAKQ